MKKVLIIDDSVIFRTGISQALEGHPQFDVVGKAKDGEEGLSKALELQPDVITCDLEMPVKDGLSFIREFRKVNKGARIIVFSSRSERGARITMDCLLAGADDFLDKTSLSEQGSDSVQAMKELLIPRIEQFFKAGARASKAAGATPIKAATKTPQVAVSGLNPKLLLIGSSTGGPEALKKFLPQLSASFKVPILIAQHMPALFTKELANYLNKYSEITVKEAEDNETLQAGTAYISPGDWHMELLEIAGIHKVRLNQNEKVNYVRPSVDVLFASAQKIFGNQVMAFIFTGMGSDGAEACERLFQAGAPVHIQDRESSVVWGMPGAVFARSAFTSIGDLRELARIANEQFASGRANFKAQEKLSV